MKRRQFIKTTAAASAAFSAMPLMGLAKPARKYKTVLIGSGWWGMNILNCALATGDIKVSALCDADSRQFNAAADSVEKSTGKRPKTYYDYREMLRKEKPDIAIVGTPDHWHALNAIEAMQAGAHVYLEKPIGHTINEGKALVKTAQETGKVVQVGLHRHISPHNVSGIEFLRQGKAGKIGMVQCFVNYGFPHRPAPAPTDPPEGLDWDLWCGPAPLLPYNEGIHPKGFRQYLEFSNGTAADWGVHWFDQVLWWTEEKFPKRVSSTGGRAIKDDVTTAPDHQVINFEFEDFTCTWEHRLFGGSRNENHNVGIYFHGTEGVFHMGWRDGWTFYPNNKKKEIINTPPKLYEPDWHNIPELWADFMQSIEKGKKPVADIVTGHQATNMSLLGMIALQTGRTIEWDGEKEQILHDQEATRLMRRDYRPPWQYPAL